MYSLSGQSQVSGTIILLATFTQCLIQSPFLPRPFSSSFRVKIGREETIFELRDVIKEEYQFSRFGSSRLRLWKANIQYGNSEGLQRFESGDNEELSPIMKVGDLFPEDLPDDRIYIIVKARGK